MTSRHILHQHRSSLWLLLLLAALLLAIGCASDEATTETAEEVDGADPGYEQPNFAERAFRPAVNEPPPDWTGPVFALSHDYPQTLPAGCDSMPWLSVEVDFANPDWYAGGWATYAQTLLDYFKEGQNDQLANEVGWQVDVGGATRWFHVPWMAFDRHSGREFVHGLTNELSVDVQAFDGPGRGTGGHHLPLARSDSNGDGQTEQLYETWAFGVYNECGAYSIGQGWPASGEPAMTVENGMQRAKGLPFKNGAMVVKFLFTTAGAPEVPYLEGSPAWQAHAHVENADGSYEECKRAIRDVHLVQVDVGVIDERSPTRWVFGTFGYNSTLGGDTVWANLSPLGMEWGSDPSTFPAVPENESQPVRESSLAPIDIYEHYGCNGRLAGPVDQPTSSCVTCHMGAFTADVGGVPVMGENIPPIFNFDGICDTYNQDNAYYFSNYAYPEPYPDPKYAEAIPLDSSLQLQVAFIQYGTYNTTGKSGTCTDGDGDGS